MKKIYLSLFVLFVTFNILAQSPQAFKYQALARDEAGNTLSMWNLSLRVSLIQEGTDGLAVYIETHKVKTNIYGLINLIIGEGDVVQGEFNAINWGEQRHYIKVEMDINAGENYKDVGTSQLYAVPYALYAEQAGKLRVHESQETLSTRRSQYKNPKSQEMNREDAFNSKFPSNDDSYMNVNIGNVGIGTTSPTEKLDVNGKIKSTALVLTDANGYLWEVDIDTSGSIRLVGIFDQCGDWFHDDRDWQNYLTVQIGSQCWMAQNINIGKRIDAALNQTDNGIIEKFCYDNEEVNCNIYGALYQWNETMQYTTDVGNQGICPEGWHIPTSVEWDIMLDFLGGYAVVGGELKEVGLDHWNSPNTGANNSSGFTAFAGGRRHYSGGDFYDLGNVGLFWSTTEYTVSDVWRRKLSYNSIYVDNDFYDKMYGFSVRCLQD